MASDNDKTRLSNSREDEKPKLSVVDSLIGTLFADKYEIISLLGEGGMSKVYKARHKFMKRIVAVKLLHEDLTSDATAKARFQQEAEAASALNHQNVVTVFDFGFTTSGQAFFVMDCLEGKSLEQLLLDSGSLPIAQSIEIFTQACEGLDHAHRKGIIHRDIKPSNLVIIKQDDGSDLVKLVDFGIAKLIASASEEQRQRLTLAGEVFGTPAYMSPEQCHGRDLDARSDIYSFGCLMYETLAGTPPLLGDTLIATITKHISERPTPLVERGNIQVSPHTDAVIMKCLEKEPENRYASAMELRQALMDAAFASGVQGLRVGAVPVLKQNRPASKTPSQNISLAEKAVTLKWRLKLGVTLLLGAVVLAGILAYLFIYTGPEGDKGTIINKLMWQTKLSQADSLMKEQKFQDAISELKSALPLAEGFADDRSRYELTLTKLGEAYAGAHIYSQQEAINKQINDILSERIFREYDTLMKLLSDWEKPTTDAEMKDERLLQAVAFAERIASCAEKLSIRSRGKEEQLLKKAIKLFDSMELLDWKASVRFRIKLAECYRSQQRFDEENTVLLAAEKLCPDSPKTQEGWRLKIETQLLLGQLERNVVLNRQELDQARLRLEKVLSWIRKNLSQDQDLLKDSLNSLAILEQLYHDKLHDEKAAAYHKEALLLEK